MSGVLEPALLYLVKYSQVYLCTWSEEVEGRKEAVLCPVATCTCPVLVRTKKCPFKTEYQIEKQGRNSVHCCRICFIQQVGNSFSEIHRITVRLVVGLWARLSQVLCGLPELWVMQYKCWFWFEEKPRYLCNNNCIRKALGASVSLKLFTVKCSYLYFHFVCCCSTHHCSTIFHAGFVVSGLNAH